MVEEVVPVKVWGIIMVNSFTGKCFSGVVLKSYEI